MVETKCGVCGSPLEAGYVSTTNGSGLLWAHDNAEARFRPTGLEVLVPTGFGGTYSANLPGARCRTCRTITLTLPK
jgi:hypothetical protein